jgi:phospholipase C
MAIPLEARGRIHRLPLRVLRVWARKKKTPVKWSGHRLMMALLALFGAAVSNAQTSPSSPPGQVSTPNTPVQHVILIIQENRTPDNLFLGDQALVHNGAHLASSGSCHGIPIKLTPIRLDACFDLLHTHPAWVPMYDQGKMDGACDIPVTKTQSHCFINKCSDTAYSRCPQYSYVPNTKFDGVHGILDPYFQLAEQYGFANYMFQTNQGPSYSAHHFLFAGTSQPDAYPTTYYDWFAEGIAPRVTVSRFGCTATLGTTMLDISPSGSLSNAYTPPDPPGANQGFPCYDHPTLPDVLEPAGVTWRYYGWSLTSRWTAPNSIDHICKPSGFGGFCQGSAFKTGQVTGNPALVLTDLGVNGSGTQSCKLPKVSWVIPDDVWSDHPGTEGRDGGPSWVAAIVNAVGGYDNSGNKLPVQCNYWANTVILILWDDWGGFYDDVNPIATIGGGSTGYVGGSGNGVQYVYGFRVPLIVVSPYAKKGYISGPASNPTCPNFYCHDFGSMLNFIEYAFGSNGKSLGTIGPPEWPYADFFVQDTSPRPNNYSLYDFFDWRQTPRPFVPITGAKYSTTCFLKPTNCFTGFAPSAPDSD